RFQLTTIVSAVEDRPPATRRIEHSPDSRRGKGCPVATRSNILIVIDVLLSVRSTAAACAIDAQPVTGVALLASPLASPGELTDRPRERRSCRAAGLRRARVLAREHPRRLSLVSRVRAGRRRRTSRAKREVSRAGGRLPRGRGVLRSRG